MTIGCEDICGYIIDQLKDMGYKLEEHPRHEDILKILKNDVELTMRNDYPDEPDE